MNLKLNSKQLKIVGINHLKNEIYLQFNLITGNKVSLNKIIKNVELKKSFK